MAKKYEIGLVASVWFHIDMEADSMSEAAGIAQDMVKSYSLKDLKRDLKNEGRANDWQLRIAGIFDSSALDHM